MTTITIKKENIKLSKTDFLTLEELFDFLSDIKNQEEKTNKKKSSLIKNLEKYSFSSGEGKKENLSLNIDKILYGKK